MGNQMKPKARQDNIVVQTLNHETLIYDLSENKAFCLNDTSALVWRMCDGKRSVEDIGNELSTRFKTPASNDLVYLALDQLGKDGLLETQIENRFLGLSRREVIRKVGFASAIALPLISSIIAPTALMAQSVCVPGTGTGGTATTCASDNDCIECGCFRRNPIDGTSHCCVTGTVGVNGSAVNPGGFLDCFQNDAGGNASCAAASNICCNGSSTATGLQGVCPAASQQECRCNP